MSNQRFLLFSLLLAYIFTPTIFNWVISPSGSWYKPFIVWILIILGAYFLDKYRKPS